MIDAMFRILALIRKELLAILKEPRSRAVVIVPTIMQTLLFGYGLSYDLSEVPYALVDEDHSAASRALVARLDGAGIFHRVADVERTREIETLIDDREVLVVVRIGPDFERRLHAGDAAPVQVIGDGRNSNTAGVAMNYVAAVIESFNAEYQASGAPTRPIRLVARTWYNPNLETRWTMVPALIATLTLLGTLILTALSVAREREQGTFDQLLVTPFRPGEIIVGKTIPSLLIGLAQATAVLMIAQLWFGIPFAGSLLTLYAGLVLFLLAAVGIGLFVSSLAATMQQAMLFAFVLVMPFTLLSGFLTPVANMPPLLQVATMVNPLRHGIELVQRVYLEGADFLRLLPVLIPLAITAAITLTVSAWFFRHRLP